MITETRTHVSDTTTRQAVFDIPRAAALLGLTEKALRRQVERGRIPFRRLGRKLIFLESEIQAWLETLPGVTLKDVQEMRERS